MKKDTLLAFFCYMSTTCIVTQEAQRFPEAISYAGVAGVAAYLPLVPWLMLSAAVSVVHICVDRHIIKRQHDSAHNCSDKTSTAD